MLAYYTTHCKIVMGLCATPRGKIADYIRYLAICKYENDTRYYLFGCNAEYEVVSDSPWHSIEQCMLVAKNSYDRIISWIAMNEYYF